jgi:hypothetical protein
MDRPQVARRALAHLLGVSVLTAACSVVAASPAAAAATPSLTSTASGNTIVGLQVFDNVNLSGGANPTGTVSYALFGPGDTGCASPIFTSTIAVNGAGSYNSAHFTTSLAGTYQWEASYSGDANNNPISPTSCTVAVESVIVSQANTGLGGTSSPGVPLGGTIHDTATIGGFRPTGTINFRLSGPTDTFCGATPVFTANVPVTTGAGSYQSPSFTPAATGTYRWQVGYSGDVNNQPVNRTSCLDSNEAVTITQGATTPTMSATASPSVAIGGTVTDSATLSGGSSPTGTIAFSLFAPNDTTCATAVFTSTRAVTGNGPYSSTGFNTAAVGDYRWTASYGGDANNGAVASGCGAANQTVTVTKANTSVVSQASAAVVVGRTVSDSGVLSGGFSPTGTITFDLFGPGNTVCTGVPAFVATKAVSGNGSYASPSVTATAVGTYRWVAAYSGDSANAAAGPTACGDPAGVVVVSPAAPTMTAVATPPATTGGAIVDTATLAQGVNPTGTITFKLFGPGDATCSGAPVLTSTRTVAGNGNYISDPYTVTLPGGYRFEASYSGDASNTATPFTSCGAAANTVTVNVSSTTTAVVSSANPSIAGQAVAFTATVSAGDGGGTVSYFADASPAAISGCALLPLAPAPAPGTGAFIAGCSTSALAAGVHVVSAAYSGDALSAASSGTLGGQAVNQGPAITSGPGTTFTVGVAGSFSVTATGYPAPTVTLSGALPSGVTFNGATSTLGGIPQPATVGTYPVTVSAANGVGSPRTVSLTVTVNQATMVYPVDGQANVDTSRPFTWSTIPQAQAYYLVVGTAALGHDLVNSGVLPPTQSSLTVPPLPAGATLYATMMAEVNGGWGSYQAITFTASAGQATFAFPLDGQATVDPTRPFRWSTVQNAEGYLLAVGTNRYGSDIVSSGLLPAGQSSYATPILPPGRTLYAILWTKVNGAFVGFQSITFTAGPAMGTFVGPTNGAVNLVTPSAFTWTPIAAAQNYYLAVGTTAGGYDLVNTGPLAPSQTSFTVPALPHGQLLYATLYTKVNGVWVGQMIGFTPA